MDGWMDGWIDGCMGGGWVSGKAHLRIAYSEQKERKAKKNFSHR